MWKLLVLLGYTGSCLQMIACHRPCFLSERTANCASRQYEWVPSLPPDITHLSLQLNHIREINSSTFRDYKELQFLDLGMQNGTLTIRSNSFLHQKKLTDLILGSNRDLQLEPLSFKGLSNLKQLFVYHCDLTESFLSENFLEPLLSLEVLDLFGNKIAKLQPGSFFSNLTKITYVDLKLNAIGQICEEDLVAFRGKYFTYVNLGSNRFGREDTDWATCGSPFKGVSFGTLDLSNHGSNLETTRQFFQAISGTPISRLIYSGSLGKGFSHDNIRDPDESTFQGLAESSVIIFDISGNRIFALKARVFSALAHVAAIDASRNRINLIEMSAFAGLDGHLKKLNLSSNLLGDIRSSTFGGLTELIVLDLSFNHIGVLGYESFSGLPKLRDLYLTGNSLRTLGFPASLPELNFLFLGDNRLTSISSILDLGANSFYVDITNNRLTNLEDVYVILSRFGRLNKLYYGGNYIKWCTMNELFRIPHNNSLQLLDLHGSYLQLIWAEGKCLDLFDPLSNLLQLNISYNSLTHIPWGVFRGLTSIITIDLSSNALTYLQPGVFPDSLKILHLSDNFLATPDPSVFQTLVYLDLSENRFLCDCTLESLLQWLNMTNVTFFSPLEELKCEFPADVHGLPLLEYSTVMEPCEVDDEKTVAALRFALFILSATLVVTTTLSGIIYARLRGQLFLIYKKMVGRVLEGPKVPPAEINFLYDAFFCFSNKDYGWVEGALLKKLDKQFSEENSFRCCFEARDFLPGEDHLTNIRDAIWASRKTVCIVSKEFLKDGWCLEAFSLAQGRMLEELTNVLIMLVVGRMAHYQLMKCNAVRAFVRRREYLTWPEDPQDMDWFYEQLSSQILKDTKLKKFVEDKPGPVEAARERPQHDGVEHINLENLPADG